MTDETITPPIGYPLDSGYFDGLVCTGEQEEEVHQVFVENDDYSDGGIALAGDKVVATGRQWHVHGNPGVSGDGSYFAQWRSLTSSTSFGQSPQLCWAVEVSHATTLGFLVQKDNVLRNLKGGFAVLGYLTHHFGKEPGNHIAVHRVGPGKVVVLFDLAQKQIFVSVNGQKVQATKNSNVTTVWPAESQELVPFLALEAEGELDLPADDSDEEDEDQENYQATVLDRTAAQQIAPDLAK
mmetsp:Transcript_24222/g.50349  ORF Transcript_24222/g.50349 Transcript_24222/m.50349 type:complete len:239 (+) Transcript_24222:151-867(+)